MPSNPLWLRGWVYLAWCVTLTSVMPVCAEVKDTVSFPPLAPEKKIEKAELEKGDTLSGGVIPGQPIECPTDMPTTTINLADVVSRALCSSPDTRQTWAMARGQAAQLGIEKSAFYPYASASLEGGRGSMREHYGDNTSASSKYYPGSLSLAFTWLLFDLGADLLVFANIRLLNSWIRARPRGRGGHFMVCTSCENQYMPQRRPPRERSIPH